MSTIDLVIARYNESLDFLDKEPFVSNVHFRRILYNKGNPIESTKFYKYHELANVGKCDHTYLHHIVENYDTLGEITLFVPGSCMDVDYKIKKTVETIERMNKTQKTTMFGFFISGLASVAQFQLNTWESSSIENKTLNQGESKLTPSEIRPFGKWYQSMFGRNQDLHFICYNGIFAIHRNDILQHPKSFYQTLLHQVETCINPEVGHYIERSWVTIFGPLSILSLHVFIL